ncbi:uncharacterized protein LOC132196202 isoform X3 [Neocloeon triangulifer]|uniref:uncharacterized protein LOC132196202 isoform X3 n=1 Tax=Neocloeon triangulifer TaxID=2078957 RepID=UPI00286F463B|nr:uncharacterized protein LOC132196202 isoform X3 [Neocloeon triangulifer]
MDSSGWGGDEDGSRRAKADNNKRVLVVCSDPQLFENDVKKLKETYAVLRNFRFDELRTSSKSDLMQKLEKWTKELANLAIPSVLIVYHLSVATEGNTVSKEELLSALQGLEGKWENCIKLVFLEVVPNNSPTESPKIRIARTKIEKKNNTCVMHLETTELRVTGGSWLVFFSCNHLNEIVNEEDVAQFVKSVHGRIKNKFHGIETSEVEDELLNQNFTFHPVDRKIIVERVVEAGFGQGPTNGPAQLGLFDRFGQEQKADNVFVLVAHYTGEGDSKPRLGNAKDVENLRKTFADNRNCRFREWSSPIKEDLFALLADEKKLMKYFASEESRPRVIIFIILSHGGEKGKIYTDKMIGLEYRDNDSFNTKDLFQAINNTFPDALKFIISGHCRGNEREKLGPTSEKPKKENLCKVDFYPEMRNVVVVNSTIDSFVANRRPAHGTFFIQNLCKELNEMTESASTSGFLTAVLNNVHAMVTNKNNSLVEVLEEKKQWIGQTPEFKINALEKKFTIVPPIETRVAGTPKSTARYAWCSSDKPYKECRQRYAVIYGQGQETPSIKKLQSVLQIDLEFETINKDYKNFQIDLGSNENCWDKYGCWAAFFFAEICEVDGQICIQIDQNKAPVKIGEMIDSKLGPKNKDWIGKPKFFFFFDKKFVTTKREEKNIELKIQRATNRSGVLCTVFKNEDLIERFIDSFANINKKNQSLQDFIDDLLTDEKLTSTKQAMLMSTLQFQLTFPPLSVGFGSPNFQVLPQNGDAKNITFDKLVTSIINKTSQIWLFSVKPGKERKLLMPETAYQLQKKSALTININWGDIAQKIKKKGDLTKDEATGIVCKVTDIRKKEFDEKQNNLILLLDHFGSNGERFLKVMAECNLCMVVQTKPEETENLIKRLGPNACIAKLLDQQNKCKQN